MGAAISSQQLRIARRESETPTNDLVEFMVHILLLLSRFRMYVAINRNSGDNEVRTHDPLLARQVLSQLSYTPIVILQSKIAIVKELFKVLRPWSLQIRTAKKSVGFSWPWPMTMALLFLYNAVYLDFALLPLSCQRVSVIWQPPALPHRLQCSTIGRLGLNHRVRDGYGCFP